MPRFFEGGERLYFSVWSLCAVTQVRPLCCSYACTSDMTLTDKMRRTLSEMVKSDVNAQLQQSGGSCQIVAAVCMHIQHYL
jgi:hypothetical protein